MSALTREAFRGANKQNYAAVDGVDPMNFLNQTDDYVDVPRPNPILLNPNLPEMDGGEVLSRIKSDDGVKRIPTVILTISAAAEEVVWSYEPHHANVCLRNRLTFHDFEELALWLIMALLPQHEPTI